MLSRFETHWVDRKVEPKGPSDPRYPTGITIDMSGERKGCIADVPYPAPRCGYHVIKCTVCGTQVIVTTAGRADDPRQIKIACKLN